MNNLDYFTAMLMCCQEVRRCGSATVDLCSVTMGRPDGCWELKRKPWDLAAGCLIVNEAGGALSTVNGRTFHIREDSVVASNGILHGQIPAALAARPPREENR